MKEQITYEITDPDGKQRETKKKHEARKALFNGSSVIENKLIISLEGATFIRLFTSTQMCSEHFREGVF